MILRFLKNKTFHKNKNKFKIMKYKYKILENKYKKKIKLQ